MIERETLRAAHQPEDHIDRYVDLMSRLVVFSAQIQEVTEPHLGFQKLVYKSIYRCYIFLKDAGHEELARSFISNRV